jgi:energy-converting hydrogenase Eha subunit G
MTGGTVSPAYRFSLRLCRTASIPAAAMEGLSMLAIIAGILIVLWLAGFFAFHVASGLIHILLVLAVIAIIIHFVTGRRAV